MGLAANQHAVAVLSGALVLPRVRLVALTPFGEVSYEQRAVGEYGRPDARCHGNTVTSPGDGDGTFPFNLAV